MQSHPAFVWINSSILIPSAETFTLQLYITRLSHNSFLQHGSTLWVAVPKHTSRAITLKNATARLEVWDEIFTAHFPKIIQNLVQPAFIHGKKKTNIDVYMQTSHCKWCDSQYKGKHVGCSTKIQNSWVRISHNCFDNICNQLRRRLAS